MNAFTHYPEVDAFEIERVWLELAYWDDPRSEIMEPWVEDIITADASSICIHNEVLAHRARLGV